MCVFNLREYKPVVRHPCRGCHLSIVRRDNGLFSADYRSTLNLILTQALRARPQIRWSDPTQVLTDIRLMLDIILVVGISPAAAAWSGSATPLVKAKKYRLVPIRQVAVV